MHPRSRELLSRLAYVTTFAMCLGLLAGLGQALAQGVSPLIGVVRGILIGLFSGASIGSIELLLDRGPLMWRIRRLPGLAVQLIRLLLFIGVLFMSILLGLWLASEIMNDPIEGALWSRLVVSSSLLALALSFMVMPVFKIMQLLSIKTLGRAMLGRYLHPRREARGILFMDMKGSTSLIEDIGDKDFLRFLNEVLFEINGVILEYKGEIYRYVGDEFIVTWSEDTVQESLGCIVAIQQALRDKTAHFERRFNHAPSFRYGLHFGEIMVGELGDLRTEIAFIGDAINTTKRIEDVCRHFNFDVLASSAYLERVSFPEDTRTVPVEAIRLRGKSSPMQLYGITKRNQPIDEGGSPAETSLLY